VFARGGRTLSRESSASAVAAFAKNAGEQLTRILRESGYGGFLPKRAHFFWRKRRLESATMDVGVMPALAAGSRYLCTLSRGT
jgi:hypothetical protein